MVLRLRKLVLKKADKLHLDQRDKVFPYQSMLAKLRLGRTSDQTLTRGLLIIACLLPVGLMPLFAQENTPSPPDIRSAIESVVATRPALRCVVIALPEERTQAQTAVAIANQGDYSGLQVFAQSHHWALQTDSTKTTEVFLFSPGVIRTAEGVARLETDLLNLLLSWDGAVDLSTDANARTLLAEWMDTALSPDIAHLAQARNFISHILGVPFQEVLAKGLTRVELFGNIAVQYDIPGVEGRPSITITSLTFPTTSPREQRHTSTPSPSFDGAHGKPDHRGNTELIVLYSVGLSESRAESLMNAFKALKDLGQKARKILEEATQRVQARLKPSWNGPALEVWHEYGTLPVVVQHELVERLQQMRPFFEATEQLYPAGDLLPAGTRVYYELQPAVLITMQYGDRTLRVAIDIGQVENHLPFLRGIQFTPPD
ncbi:hypothetical protein HRbin15_02157 [bacterium HR15]|nr:hypothetical protein HRbin15_02157 [bacterium HR15]